MLSSIGRGNEAIQTGQLKKLANLTGAT